MNHKILHSQSTPVLAVLWVLRNSTQEAKNTTKDEQKAGLCRIKLGSADTTLRRYTGGGGGGIGTGKERLARGMGKV